MANRRNPADPYQQSPQQMGMPPLPDYSGDYGAPIQQYSGAPAPVATMPQAPQGIHPLTGAQPSGSQWDDPMNPQPQEPTPEPQTPTPTTPSTPTAPAGRTLADFRQAFPQYQRTSYEAAAYANWLAGRNPWDNGATNSPPGQAPGTTPPYIPGTPTTPAGPGGGGDGPIHPNPAGDTLRIQWDSMNHNPQQFVQWYIQQNQLVGHQADPRALQSILSTLQQLGVNAQMDPRTDGYKKGLIIDGHFVKMLDGSDRWIWDTSEGSTTERRTPTMPQNTPMPGTGTNPALDAFDEQWRQAILKLMAPKDLTDQDYSAAYEHARAPIDQARNVQTSSLEAELASRGLLHGGAEATGLAQLEQGLAPSYTAAYGQARTDLNQQLNQQRDQQINALNVAGNHTGVMAGLALQQLQTNIGWQEFLANYGLNQAALEAQISQGNYSQLLQMLQLYLAQAQATSGGHV